MSKFCIIAIFPLTTRTEESMDKSVFWQSIVVFISRMRYFFCLSTATKTLPHPHYWRETELIDDVLIEARQLLDSRQFASCLKESVQRYTKGVAQLVAGIMGEGEGSGNLKETKTLAFAKCAEKLILMGHTHGTYSWDSRPQGWRISGTISSSDSNHSMLVDARYCLR